jgi:hypothetical protein
VKPAVISNHNLQIFSQTEFKVKWLQERFSRLTRSLLAILLCHKINVEVTIASLVTDFPFHGYTILRGNKRITYSLVANEAGMLQLSNLPIICL